MSEALSKCVSAGRIEGHWTNVRCWRILEKLTTTQMTTVIRIDLVYDKDCPNVDRARAAIRAALHESGADVNSAEWDRDSSVTPTALRHYGSPTVLVNGKDVSIEADADSRSDANACRIYRDESDRFCGAPSPELIARAIRTAVAR